MSILEQEIHEQPDAIQRLLQSETENVLRLAANLKRQGKEAGLPYPFNYVMIAARGSSDNAARYAQYLFGAHNRLPVALATPSLFGIYNQPPDLSGALVIGVSQSGQSPDIVHVLAEARRQGRPTIAITNDPESPLADTADTLIRLHAGKEKAVAATKTYTTSLAALALFSTAIGGDQECLAQLHRLPKIMEQTLGMLEPARKRVERYRYMEHCIVIGRGYNYSTAFEIALKIKELTSTVTEQYSSADFRHGPIAMIQEGFPVIIVSPTSAVSNDLQSMVEELKKLGAELLMISDQEQLLSKSELALPIPSGIQEWLTPMVTVLPGQVFGLALAESKGLNPDQPLGLKKVTETL